MNNNNKSTLPISSLMNHNVLHDLAYIGPHAIWPKPTLSAPSFFLPHYYPDGTLSAFSHFKILRGLGCISVVENVLSPQKALGFPASKEKQANKKQTQKLSLVRLSSYSIPRLSPTDSSDFISTVIS